jgi:protein phosphatase
LTGQITDDEIGVLLHVLPIGQAAQVLVDLANLRGGPDNITVIIVEVTAAGIETRTAGKATSVSTELESKRPRFSTALGVVAGICFLATLLLVVSGVWPLAVVTGVLGVIALSTGLVQMRAPSASREPHGDRYGRAPYRRYSCEANRRLIDPLQNTLQLLRDAAIENQWSIRWQEIDQRLSEAKTAEQTKKYTDAIAVYGKVLIDLMQQIREQRSDNLSDSSVDL